MDELIFRGHDFKCPKHISWLHWIETQVSRAFETFPDSLESYSGEI